MTLWSVLNQEKTKKNYGLNQFFIFDNNKPSIDSQKIFLITVFSISQFLGKGLLLVKAL
jgi:hypothetical protein